MVHRPATTAVLLLLALTTACPSPAHSTPVYESDPNAEPTEPRVSQGDETPVEPQGPGRQAVDRPFLYAIRNAEQPSYLLGTIHVGVSLEEALPGNHFEALAQPRVVMVEVDPATVSPQSMVESGRLRRGSLDQLLPAVIWHDLTAELENVMASQGLKQMRPWFAMMMLTQERVREMHRGRPPQGMDLSIVNYAREQNITLTPLESAADQLEALNSVPDGEIIQILTEMVQSNDASTAELSEMLSMYRLGDENRMTQLIFDPSEMARAPGMYRSLFTRRNAAWLPAIKEQLEEGGAFIAVGLGHLLGDEGLLAKLREEGFPIERVQ